MQQWSLRLIPKILLHFLLWTGVWLFFIYFFSYATVNQDFVFVFASSLLPITIIVTYVIAYHLVPTYLLKSQYFKFGLYLGYTMIFSLFLIIIITFVNFIFLSNFDMRSMPVLSRNFLFVFILIYLVAGLASFIKVIHFNYKMINEKTELEKKLLVGQLRLKEKELSLLKEQIHPHFLFNTLNTIYGAALKESNDTPDLILKLSSLLDYTLNQIDKPTVPISEEINYIDAYVGLERVRFKDSLKVSFDKQIEKEIQVPPMLFIALVENAFKHGSAVDGFLKIIIKLSIVDNLLEFSIKNTIGSNDKKRESHGLGLSNTKKRLDVLYPNTYIIQQSQDDKWFYITLIISLKDE